MVYSSRRPAKLGYTILFSRLQLELCLLWDKLVRRARGSNSTSTNSFFALEGTRITVRHKCCTDGIFRSNRDDDSVLVMNQSYLFCRTEAHYPGVNNDLGRTRKPNSCLTLYNQSFSSELSILGYLCLEPKRANKSVALHMGVAFVYERRA